MSRIADLLNKSADALDLGQDPLTNPFLRANEVTFNECLDLADNLALGARIVAWAHENPRLFGQALRGASEEMRLQVIIDILKRWSETDKAKAEAER